MGQAGSGISYMSLSLRVDAPNLLAELSLH